MVNKKKKEIPADNTGRTRLFLGLIALLLYSASVGYKYTMDDDVFFLKHQSVQKGVSAIGEIFSYGSMEKFDGTKGVQTYRPVYVLGFAIEKQLFGEVPAISHLINILLYALLAMLLFDLLRALFREWQPLTLAAATLLFIVHPLHTEVVASVKSRDELMAGVFLLVAWRHYINLIDTGKSALRWTSLLFFALASFSKESTISFLAVFPLSAVMFRKTPVSKAVLSILPYAAISAAYLGIRVAIEGTENAYSGLPILANILTGAKGFNELYATKLELLWYNLKMTVVPWPMTWDYSYNQIPIVTFSSLLPWLSLLLYAGMLLGAVWSFRKHPVLSFAAFYFLITSSPTNNFFINNTTTFGERLLFMPSLWICITIVWLAARYLKTDPSAVGQHDSMRFRRVMAFPVVVFLLLTMFRLPDWKDNLSLFRSGVEVAPNSSRTQYSLASELFKLAPTVKDPVLRKNYLDEAGICFRKSVEILPINFQAYYNYALYNAYVGDTAASVAAYEKVLSLKPDFLEAMNNLGVVLLAQKDYARAEKYYLMAYSLNPDAPLAGANLAGLYFNHGLSFNAAGLNDSAIVNYWQAIRYSPTQVMAYNNIAAIYAGQARYDSCLANLKRAYSIEPGNLMVLENIGAVSFLAKEYQQGIDFAGKALAINPGLTKSLNTMVNCLTATGRNEEAASFRARLSNTGTQR